MFHWRSDLEGVRRAFTSRIGGVSRGPYAGLNLGGHVGDDPDRVEENRRRLAAAIDVDPHALAFMDQVHGAEVAVVEEPSARPPRADALVTTRDDVALVVLVADCVPILLSSVAGDVVGVAHAGRQGMVRGVVPQVVSTMLDLGARDLVAAVGPSVCPRCYEVPEEMRSAAARVSPVAAGVSWTGTPAIDVAAGVVDQLHVLGVSVEWVPGCTREDPDLFSHRREAPTGRFAGVVARVGR